MILLYQNSAADKRGERGLNQLNQLNSDPRAAAKSAAKNLCVFASLRHQR
jgi:hypothetical protein